MKRSKMIKLLEDTFLKRGMLGKHMANLAAKEILQEIENVGMTPPYSDKVFQKNARIYIEPSGREWEPEEDIT